jgi:hypothetical protein
MDFKHTGDVLHVYTTTAATHMKDTNTFHTVCLWDRRARARIDTGVIRVHHYVIRVGAGRETSEREQPSRKRE